jgi:hypothetical protein
VVVDDTELALRDVVTLDVSEVEELATVVSKPDSVVVVVVVVLSV